MPNYSVDEDTLVILSQVFIAFGQGAEIPVSREALIEGIRFYLPRVENKRNDWDTIAGRTLAVAKGLGRVAAHMATGQGRIVVSDEDYRNAAERLFAPCPLCMHEGDERLVR